MVAGSVYRCIFQSERQRKEGSGSGSRVAASVLDASDGSRPRSSFRDFRRRFASSPAWLFCPGLERGGSLASGRGKRRGAEIQKSYKKCLSSLTRLQLGSPSGCAGEPHPTSLGGTPNKSSKPRFVVIRHKTTHRLSEIIHSFPSRSKSYSAGKTLFRIWEYCGQSRAYTS